MNYRVQSITSPPKHHFFGYYDMRPWDPTGRYHLVLEVDFMDRPPTAQDKATVGAVDLQDGNKFIPLSETFAWNFQQGTMLNWWPGHEHTALFNDRREGRFVCVAHEMDSGSERIIGPAIGALSDDGRLAATLNYARLAVIRPGYGYEGLDDPFADEDLPTDDGLGVLDTATGEHRIIVSIADVAGMQHGQLRVGPGKKWFNHAVFNPSATRLAFFLRWPIPSTPYTQGRFEQIWTVDIDGQNPVQALDGTMVSHFDWKDDETIVAYSGVKDVDAVWEFDALGRGEPRAMFQDIVKTDGHVCLSHDRRWMAIDTYPDTEDMRKLSIIEYDTGVEVPLGAYYSPELSELKEIRCDFHPSWSDDDRRIAFDGMHEGTRQRYVVELHT